jgi:plasmid maintenance system antidote protein VapI
MKNHQIWLFQKLMITFANNLVLFMYEQYLSTSTIPAGAVLKRILQKERIGQKEVALKASLFPQRINDLITGKRKFTPEMSVCIEKALGLSEPGYFYKIQSNYEIYRYKEEQEKKDTPNLDRLNEALFWDTNMRDMNWKKNANWVIKRVFEYGQPEEIEEIIRYYGKEKVAEVLNSINDTWKEKERNKNTTIYLFK